MALGKTILVVDDDPVVRQLIADVLAAEDRFVVHGATDAAQALQAARQFVPDLIIIDAQIAQSVSGRELIRPADQHRPAVPVLRLVSGIPDPMVLQEFAELHGFDLNQFLARVHHLIGVAGPDVSPPGPGRDSQVAVDFDDVTGPGVGKTILIVEDLPEIRMLLSAMLASAGYTVVTAVDGPSGLAAARTSEPDLVILDHQMPGLTGLQVLMTLRDEGSRLPIIMLTAHGHEADTSLPWTAWTSGASLFMDKPFDRHTLLRWVGSFTHDRPR